MSLINLEKFNKANFLGRYFFAILFGFYFLSSTFDFHFIFSSISSLTFVLLFILSSSYESNKLNIIKHLKIFYVLPEAFIALPLIVGAVYLSLYSIINYSFFHLIPVYFLAVPILALLIPSTQSSTKQIYIIVILYLLDMFVFNEILRRPMGLLGSPNASAIGLVLVSFLAYLQDRRVFNLILIIPLLYAFQSASSLLIYFFVLYYAFTNSLSKEFNKLLNVSLIIFLFISIYFLFPREADIMRIYNYGEALNLIINNPFGVNDALSASSFPTYFFPSDFSFNLENSLFNLIFMFGIFSLPLILFHFLLRIKVLYFAHLVVLIITPLLSSPDFTLIYYLLSISILNIMNKSDHNLNTNV
jgi:hypothetical protein